MPPSSLATRPHGSVDPRVDALRARGREGGDRATSLPRPGPHVEYSQRPSPKAGTHLVLKVGHELKLVFPQAGAEPKQFEDLEFQHFFIQPMDGPDVDENTARTIEYCLAHPQWRLSLQTHKIVGIR